MLAIGLGLIGGAIYVPSTTKTHHMAELANEVVERIGAGGMGTWDRTPVPPTELNADVDAHLERIILQCLNKEPSRRPPEVEVSNARRHLTKAIPPTPS